MVVRLPFLGTIGPDEGGYAYIASRWADGHQLYRDAWIDRPQGLILAYRLLLWFGHHAWALRVGPVVAGALITLLLVAAGRAVTPAAGLIAGALFATVGVAPHIEGFTFNGELAACVPATAAVAAAFAAYRRTSRLGLAVAALLGSTAILMKQSGFDGLVVVFAVAWVGARTPSDRRARMGFAAAGATPPLAASAVAGWSTGWSSYWSAVVGSHLGPGLESRASHLVASLPAASRDLLPLV